MIYCVVPRELEADLFEKLVAHYQDNPGVTVIVDRRQGPDPRRGKRGGDVAAEKRVTRDRRRARVPGTFPSTDVPDA
jgi:hypothetical protein